MIHPSIIQPFTQTGTGDMGDVTDVSSVARFSLPGVERYVLATLRALFTKDDPAASGSADMVLRVDHRHGPNYHFKPVTFEGVGTSGITIVEYRVPEDEMYHLIFLLDQTTGIQDVAVLEWTNPNTQRWAVEVGLIDVARLG